MASNMRRVLRFVAKDRETGWAFTVVLCGLYLAFLVFMHVHHEMWRDEVHAWTLARLAHGFWDLVTGDRLYEGHPPLWFWYLHVWTWLIKPAWGIQVATIMAAMAAAVLLVRFAPFPRFLKPVLLFSYYFGYEYTVMSRNYVLGWLCVCAFCALYHPLRVRHLAIGLVLGLLSLTSFYGLTMSLFLLGYFVLDQTGVVWSRSGDSPPRTVVVSTSPRSLITVAVTGLAVVFCVLTIEPPDPNPFAPQFIWSSLVWSAIPDMLYRYTAGFLPWRRMTTTDFWCCTFLTLWEQKSSWPNYVGGGLFALVLLALYPSWRLMLTYAGAVISMEIFEQCRHEGMPRHWGHFFMLFVAACWLLRKAFPFRLHWASTALLTLVVALQMQSSVVATAIDSRHVFSGGRGTAAFIEREGLQDLPIVAGPDYCVVTVAGYLRRKFIPMETEEVNETVVFHNRRRQFSPQGLVDKSVAVARERKSPVLLICNQGIPDPPPGTRRTLLYSSRAGTIADEVFSVYRVEVD